MAGPWAITGLDVERRFDGAGARDFASFVDDLILAEAWRGSGKLSWFQPNQKENQPDGGVDTLITNAFPRDSSSYLARPTCWQYKAGGWSETEPEKLRELLTGKAERRRHKQEARGRRHDSRSPVPGRRPSKARFLLQRLDAGDALRLCLRVSASAKELTPRTDELRRILHAEYAIPRSVAEAAEIISGAQLAGWASRFPALVLRYFSDRRALESALTGEEWRRQFRRPTRVYVPNPDWAEATALVAAHVDLTQERKGVLRVTGPAGVGKTRLVCEATTADRALRNLVVYTQRGEAVAAARFLLRNEDQHAILVADECFVEDRLTIEGLLKSEGARVRVVTIDNASVRPQAGDPQPWLAPMSEETLLEVLAQNFPARSAVQLREIARVSQGFVLFAAALCEEASVAGIPVSILDYVDGRFPRGRKERSVLEGLSLVTHVDLREPGELEALVNRMPGVSVDDFHEAVHSIHGSVGFIRRGQLLYVTPEIVAQALLPEAWRHYVEGSVNDPSAFFTALAEDCPVLLDRLATRLSEAPGLKEERALLGAYFRGSVERLEPVDLQSAHVMRRVARYVETSPELLPVLASRLERLDHAERQRIGGRSIRLRFPGDPPWGPRRYLVWLAERLAAFPEHFAAASRVLLLLADAENEQGIANNATGIWRQVHRVANSGTALEFAARLARLRHLLFGPERTFFELGLAALEEALTGSGTRTLGSPIVGGEPVPAEWRPATRADWLRCEEQALQLLEDVARRGRDEAARARELVLAHAFRLLQRGHVSLVRRLLKDSSASQQRAAREIAEDLLLRGRLDAETRTQLQEWLAMTVPHAFSERLRDVVGRSPWRSDHGALDELARELDADPTLLESELDWLCSAEALRARRLGTALAELDPAGSWVELLLEDALQRGRMTGLLAGYMSALRLDAERRSALWARLDRGETSPRLALELGRAIGPPRRAVAFAIDAVRAGTLLPACFRDLHGLVSGHGVPGTDVAAMCRLLLGEDDAGATEDAVRLLHAWAGARPKRDLWHDDIVAAAWDVLEWRAAGGGLLREESAAGSFEWCELLERVAPADPQRASAIYVSLLARLRRVDVMQLELAQHLIELDAAAFGAAFAAELLGPSGPAFFFADLSDLIRVMPEDFLRDLLDRHGVQLARVLARHVARPRLDAGQPDVAALTRYLLDRFGADERTAEGFIRDAPPELRPIDPQALEDEAEAARPFLTDDNPVIRRWARFQRERALAEAKQEREHQERFELEMR